MKKIAICLLLTVVLVFARKKSVAQMATNKKGVAFSSIISPTTAQE